MSYASDQELMTNDGISTTLFDGDSGGLPLETRRTLIKLLSGPYVDASRHPKIWSTLLRDEIVLRQRLCDLFLELIVDRESQTAFTRQARTGELEVPILLRRVQLTFLDSLVVVHLRQLLMGANARSERAVTSAAEIIEALSVYERQASTDRAGFAKKIHAVLERMKKSAILRKLRGDDERLEVAPILRLLFSAEEVGELLQEYRTLAQRDVAFQSESDSDAGEPL